MLTNLSLFAAPLRPLASDLEVAGRWSFWGGGSPVAVIASWVAQLGLDVSDFDSGVQRAIQQEKRLEQAIQRSARSLDGTQFARGLSEGVTRELSAVEARLGTLTGASARAFQQVSDDVRLATADFNAGRISTQDFAAAIGVAQRQAQLLGRTLPATSASATRGLNQIRTASFAAAASIVQLEGRTAQLLQGFLLLGAGSAAVTGIGVVLLGAAAAFQALTEAGRRSQEASDRAFQSLLNGAGTVDPLTTSVRGLASATDRLAEAQSRIQRLQGLFGEDLLGAGAVGGIGGPLGTVIGQIGALIVQRKAETAAAEAETAAIRGQNRVLDEYVSLLAFQVNERATAIQQGRGSLEILKQERSLLAAIASLTANQSLSLDQLNKLGAAIRGAQDAIKEADARPFEDQRRAVEELVQRLQVARDLHLDTAGVVAALAAEQGRVRDAVAAQGGPLRANLDTLQAMAAAAKALEVKPFEAAKALVRDLRTAAQVAEAFGGSTDEIRATLAGARFEAARLANDIAFGRVANVDAALQQFQELERSILGVQQALQAAAERPARSLAAEVGPILGQFQAMREAAAALGPQFSALGVGALEAALDRVNRAVLAQSVTGKVNADLLRLQASLGRELADALALPGNLPPFADSFTEGFARVAREADNLRKAAEAASGTPDASRLEAMADAAERAAELVGQELLGRLTALNLSAGQTAALWDEIADTARRYGVELDRAAQKQRRLAQALEGIRVADELVATANAIGLIGDEAAAALRDVAALAEGIAAIASGNILGGALGVFGAIGGLAQDIFGGDESQEAARRLIDAALALQNAADRLRGPAGADDLAAVARVANSQDFEALFQSALGGSLRLPGPVEELDRRLREAGTSLVEFQRIAEQNGIHLLDEQGRFLAEQFKALGIILHAVLVDLTQFGLGLDDQRAKLELQVKLFGGTGDANLDRLLVDQELLAQLLPDQADFIRSLDLSTQAGIDAFTKLMQTRSGCSSRDSSPRTPTR